MDRFEGDRCRARPSSSPRWTSARNPARCPAGSVRGQLRAAASKDDKKPTPRAGLAAAAAGRVPPARNGAERAEQLPAARTRRCVPCSPCFCKTEPREESTSAGPFRRGAACLRPRPPSTGRRGRRQRPHGPHADRGHPRQRRLPLAGALDMAASPAIGNDAAAFLGPRQRRAHQRRPAPGPGARAGADRLHPPRRHAGPPGRVPRTGRAGRSSAPPASPTRRRPRSPTRPKTSPS
jgi:hypothetical protein